MGDVLHLLEVEGVLIQVQSCSIAAVESDWSLHYTLPPPPQALLYLTLTCSDTYLAPKHSTMARDACSKRRPHSGTTTSSTALLGP